MITISKTVPIPSRLRNTPKFPWNKLQVGDSFFTDESTANSLYGCARSFALRHKRKLKVVIRSEKDGVRVWRVK